MLDQKLPLASDIAERIKADFVPKDAPVAIELLTASVESGRVARCIVVASNGSLQALRSYIRMAAEDFPDVIVAGEHDGGNVRARDLRASFLIDAPEKFWIAEIAAALHPRGYVLSSLETRPATAGPFQFISDYGEGVATFMGTLGAIRIAKRDRRWTFRGDEAELSTYGLHRPLEDERSFVDAISCWLAARQQPLNQV